MYLASYFLKTTDSNTGEVLDVLRSIETPVRYTKGCHDAYILQNMDDPLMVVVYELWSSRAELDRHIKSPLYRRMLAAFEMCSEKPVIKIIECNKEWGMDWIEKVLMPEVFREVS